MHLSLLLPQLLWPEPEDKFALEDLPCPALEWLLAHGVLARDPSLPYERALATVLGIDGETPFGALRLLGEPKVPPSLDAKEGYWICADPVHLRFHHEQIILAEAGAFELDEDEACALADGLNQAFSDLGRFHVADRRRWYLRLNSHAQHSFPPISAVAGRRIEGELPNEPQASKLRSRLNEIQMFLHGHPVNEARGSAGKPAVNSLWLWGAGTLPAMRSNTHDGIWSSDPLALGLARSGRVQAHPLPGHLDALLSHAAPQSHHLVVLDQLQAPAIYEDSRGWRETMIQLEANWFAPLKAVMGRDIRALTLIAPTVYGRLTWEVKGNARWQFWRRPKSIAVLAREFAQ
ncbi:MAG TPA: hypothetical protein VFF03_11995 [Rhodocyclaceae bacterium]|nr:hypothetical protein [Rhodocyclaceae bacterium]